MNSPVMIPPVRRDIFLAISLMFVIEQREGFAYTFSYYRANTEVALMGDGPQREFRYRPTYCALQGKKVWAILTQQPDGSWRTVNCLDKDASCFHIDCAFTTDQGEWPYTAVGNEQQASADS